MKNYDHRMVKYNSDGIIYKEPTTVKEVKKEGTGTGLTPEMDAFLQRHESPIGYKFIKYIIHKMNIPTSEVESILGYEAVQPLPDVHHYQQQQDLAKKEQELKSQLDELQKQLHKE